jgi:hypothetical protein
MYSLLTISCVGICVIFINSFKTINIFIR